MVGAKVAVSIGAVVALSIVGDTPSVIMGVSVTIGMVVCGVAVGMLVVTIGVGVGVACGVAVFPQPAASKLIANIEARINLLIGLSFRNIFR